MGESGKLVIFELTKKWLQKQSPEAIIIYLECECNYFSNSSTLSLGTIFSSNT